MTHIAPKKLWIVFHEDGPPSVYEAKENVPLEYQPDEGVPYCHTANMDVLIDAIYGLLSLTECPASLATHQRIEVRMAREAIGRVGK